MVRWTIALLALLVTVLAGSTGSAAAQPGLNDQDKKYLVQAHEGNLAEIAAGRLAQEKAGGTALPDIAARLIRDHTTMDENVVRVAQQAGVSLPRVPNAKQREALRDLAVQSSVGFDRGWLAAQIAAHQQSLSNGAVELAQGSSDDVKKLARDAKPIVETHLKMLQQAEPVGPVEPS